MDDPLDYFDFKFYILDSKPTHKINETKEKVGGSIYIFSYDNIERLKIDSNVILKVYERTKTYIRHPKHIKINKSQSHLIITCTKSGHVLIIELETKYVVYVLSFGEPISLAYPTNDDKFILVINNKNKIMHRIITNYRESKFKYDRNYILNIDMDERIIPSHILSYHQNIDEEYNENKNIMSINFKENESNNSNEILTKILTIDTQRNRERQHSGKTKIIQVEKIGDYFWMIRNNSNFIFIIDDKGEVMNKINFKQMVPKKMISFYPCVYVLISSNGSDNGIMILESKNKGKSAKMGKIWQSDELKHRIERPHFEDFVFWICSKDE